jgi:L-ascorbate metabolism protein UlaG (beta-lactamase superfamily)
MSPVHMSPQEVLQSHDILGSKHSVATHLGTFALAMDEQDQPPREILETRGDRRLDVMRHGQAMDLFKSP